MAASDRLPWIMVIMCPPLGRPLLSGPILWLRFYADSWNGSS